MTLPFNQGGEFFPLIFREGTKSLTVVRKVSFHSSQSSFMSESDCIIVERSIACKAERRPSKSPLRKSKTDRFSLGPALIDVFRSKIITE